MRHVVDRRHVVQPKVVRRLGGQLLHEESRLGHRQQLAHLPGSPRARGLHPGHRSFKCDPTLPPDGEEMSGARRAIETIENVFRHSLGTFITIVNKPRSQMLRFGHASVATRRPVREERRKKAVNA